MLSWPNVEWELSADFFFLVFFFLSKGALYRFWMAKNRYQLMKHGFLDCEQLQNYLSWNISQLICQQLKNDLICWLDADDFRLVRLFHTIQFLKILKFIFLKLDKIKEIKVRIEKWHQIIPSLTKNNSKGRWAMNIIHLLI